MADLGRTQNWLVSPDNDIEMKWIDVQIQERVSRIVRYKQDIEDFHKGRIIELEAKIMMLEKEVTLLQEKRVKGTPVEVTGEDNNG